MPTERESISLPTQLRKANICHLMESSRRALSEASTSAAKRDASSRRPISNHSAPRRPTLSLLFPELPQEETVDPIIYYGEHSSPFGKCFLATTGEAICYLAFPGQQKSKTLVEEIGRRWNSKRIYSAPEKSAALAEQIFAGGKKGKKRVFQLAPKGTAFQQKVWRGLAAIPTGRLLCYEDLAQLVAEKSAVRAVARAVAQNPISFLIPCHRIVRKDGSINRYRWGEALKITLLQSELFEAGEI